MAVAALATPFVAIPLTTAIFGESIGAQVLKYLTAPFIGVPFVCGLLVATSKCPRCKRMFWLKGLVSNPAAGQCMHCGLALGSPDTLER